MRFIAAIVIALLLAGCEDGGGNNGAGNTAGSEPRAEVLAETEERTAVVIRNLTPTSAVAGEATTFTFEVAYSLTDVPQGVINIGFNSWNADSFAFLGDKAIVEKGTGVKKFSVTITPVKWDEPAKFKLNVSLSEYPHPSSWTPLATTTQVIEVTQPPVVPQGRSARRDVPPVLSSEVAETCYEGIEPGSYYCIEF